MNLRERKKARTRRVLGQAAVRLFLERGFEATTIDDIVDAADVSRRTFFRYFPTKEAAFFVGHSERFETFEDLVDRRLPEVGAWRAVREALLEIARVYVADREGSVAWHLALERSPQLVAHDLQDDRRWEARIRDYFSAAGWTPLRAAVSAGALMGVIRAVLQTWYDDGGEPDLAAMGEQALDALEAGLGV